MDKVAKCKCCKRYFSEDEIVVDKCIYCIEENKENKNGKS